MKQTGLTGHTWRIFDGCYIEHGDTNFQKLHLHGGQEENGTYHLEFQSEDGSLTSSLTLKNGDEYQFSLQRPG